LAKVKLKGAKQLAAKLGKLAAAKYLKPVLHRSALKVKSKVAKYPPASEANLPGPYPARWYQRGYGARYARKSGGIGGRRTSERLGASWFTQVGAFRAVLTNKASYAPYVQKKYGKPKQTTFHAKRGWPTAEDTLQKMKPEIQRMMQAEIRKVIRN
jgi:hypothetical protein